MQNSKSTFTQMKTKQVKWSTLVLIFLAITVVAFIVVFTVLKLRDGNTKAIEKHLTTGNNHLLLMDYDEALAEYMAILDLDDQYIVAYIGIANVYKGKSTECRADDINLAIDYLNTGLEWLNNGYALTNSDTISTKIKELEKLLDSAVASANAIVEGSVEYYEYNLTKNYIDLYDSISSSGLFVQTFNNLGYNILSTDQKNEVFSSYEESLNSYLTDLQFIINFPDSNSFWSSLYTENDAEYLEKDNIKYLTAKYAYTALVNLYLCTNQPDNALAARQAYAQLAGDSAIASDGYTVKASDSDDYVKYNSYGQIIENCSYVYVGDAKAEYITKYQYDSNQRISSITYSAPGYIVNDEWTAYTTKETQITYDDLSRINNITITTTDENGAATAVYSAYAYTTDNTLDIIYTSNVEGYTSYKETITYDKFGNSIDCVTVVIN
ncbi:MAG: hypothetical protein MJ130_07305 [Lachnospiraceae bacterium]|nr:hypothetical protein [Lachnospiraceae bacterium]